MSSEQERRLRETLFHLVDLFQSEGEALSEETLEGIVQTVEGFRGDAHALLPDSGIWSELEDRIRGLRPMARRRFEVCVREMLLRQIA